MGCAHSTPVKEDAVPYKDNHEKRLPAAVEAAVAQGQQLSASLPQLQQVQQQHSRRGVSFAGDVHDTPSKSKPLASAVSNDAAGSDIDSPSRAASISGRPSRTSLVAKREKSFVGADLHAIMDDHGMLNPLVSRQLSIMSHYSVKSESGSVMITPEDAEAPFKLLRLIGRGGFGNVYLGDWDTERVAIKIIAGNTNSEAPEEQEWEARKERMAQMEAILMSAINHPNIVRTYKVTQHSGEHLDPELLNVERQLLAGTGGDAESGIPSFEWHIIMEFCDRGSLSKALASFKLHEPVDPQSVKWDAWSSLETLKEVVSALIFLHEHKILHGDLKAANVLLASSTEDRRRWIAKVADFGLARVLKDKGHIKTQTFGTVTHMPPELLAKGLLTPSSDVYAVGVLMWEIFTGEKVFKQLSDSEVILAVVTKKARPTFPSDCPPKYKFLAEKCWAEMPELRPSLETLLHELENLQELLCPMGQETSRIVCKVYPTRQRPMEQYRQQLMTAAAAAASKSEHQQSGAAAAAAASQALGAPRAPSPIPGMVPNAHAQKLSAHKSRKSANENKPGSPLGRGSTHSTGASGLIPTAPEGILKRTKSMAGEASTKSPLSMAASAVSNNNLADTRSNSATGVVAPVPRAVAASNQAKYEVKA